MAILNIEGMELSSLLDDLSGVINLNKDLPVNVFVRDGLLFWFFERPLFCFFDVLVGLISESISSFKSNVIIKFSGGEPLVSPCFSIDGDDVDKDAFWLSKNFEIFFNGKVGYPVILRNSTFDWIAFESSREEFGVIAVRS